jgi:hypothetical protein
MAVPSVPLFGNPTRITGDGIIKGSPGKIWALALEGGSDASSMDFFNDVDSADGDLLIGITAPFTDSDASAQSSVFVNFLELGGIVFDTGIYVDWTGTGAVGYIWFT